MVFNSPTPQSPYLPMVCIRRDKFSAKETKNVNSLPKILGVLKKIFLITVI